jgi:imidazole glycerol-phosphate synthase subunit HisF
MVAKRIIPALDVKEGRVVKCVRFLNPRDAGDPVDLARLYDREGADEIVFLDITASHEKRNIMLDVASRVAEEVFIPFTVGGGIRTVDDMRALLKTGADKIFINTHAVQQPQLIEAGADRFGSQCIVVAIDAKRKLSAHSSLLSVKAEPALTESGERRAASGFWEVYVHGGRTPTGMDALAWADEVARRGAGEILLTSMDADGTREGYDLPLTRQMAERVGIPVIASGGAGTLEHIHAGITEGKAEAALIASIVHYGLHSIREIKEYLRDRGVSVRL